MYSFLSLVAVSLAVIVVSSSNTIYSLIYLIGLFLTIAGLLITQGITYVGLLYIVVYVGAIAILFLFVVIMINVRDAELNTTGSNYTKNLPLTLVAGALFYYIITQFTGSSSISTTTVPLVKTIIGWSNNTTNNEITDLITGLDEQFSSFTQVEAIGIALYTWGTLWLLLAAFILLLCIIGPIVLTLREEESIQ